MYRSLGVATVDEERRGKANVLRSRRNVRNFLEDKKGKTIHFTFSAMK